MHCRCLRGKEKEKDHSAPKEREKEGLPEKGEGVSRKGGFLDPAEKSSTSSSSQRNDAPFSGSVGRKGHLLLCRKT